MAYQIFGLITRSIFDKIFPRQPYRSGHFLALRPHNVSVFRVWSYYHSHNIFLSFSSSIQISNHPPPPLFLFSGLPTNRQRSLLEDRDEKDTIPLWTWTLRAPQFKHRVPWRHFLFSNKFMARRHPISLPQIWIWWHQHLQIDPLFVWKQHVPPFAPEFPLHQIPQEPWQNSQTNTPNTVDFPFLSKNTCGTISMSSNLNTSIWMTSPPTKHPGTLVHINLSQPPPLFSFLQEPFAIPKVTEDNFQFDTKDDINRMDLCNFSNDTSSTPATPLIGKEFEKKWGTIWEVFPELSDKPREPATIPLIASSIPHKSIASTSHYSRLSHPHYHLPRSSHNHQQHQYNHLYQHPKLVETSLWTIPTIIPTTTTPSLRPVTLPKQWVSEKKTSIKELTCITIPKGHPPTLDILPFRDFRLKHHKKNNSSFTQHLTILTTSFTSNSKFFTSISTTTTTNPPPKSKITPPTNTKPTLQQSTLVTDRHHFPKRTIRTATTAIPTITTTTPLTKIPGLMRINTSTHSRFRKRSSQTSSTMIPLSSHIPPAPIFHRTLQELQQSRLFGAPPLYQRQPREFTITWQF